MQKVCVACNLPKDLEKDFAKRASSKDGRQSFCKQCQSDYGKGYYQNNTEDIKKRTAPRRDGHKAALKSLMVDYLLTHPCLDCGEDDIVVLDFDHVTGNKRFNISDAMRKGLSLEAVQQEISKCIVRCANCHRRKTAKDQNWYRLKSGNNDI